MGINISADSTGETIGHECFLLASCNTHLLSISIYQRLLHALRSPVTVYATPACMPRCGRTLHYWFSRSHYRRAFGIFAAVVPDGWIPTRRFLQPLNSTVRPGGQTQCGNTWRLPQAWRCLPATVC